MRVLITDANERAALAAARSLVRAGHTVSVCAPTRLSLAGVSRGVRSHRVAIDPLVNPAGYVAELGSLVRRGRTTVLLPMTDPSVEAVLEHRDKLPAAVIVPFPDLETYRAGSDKAHVMALAERSGFGVPRTLLMNEASDPLPSASFFPAVVKPHRSVVGVGRGRRKVGVTPVADADACRRALAALPPAAFPVLLQQHVSGAGEGFFALRWDGQIVAMFAHRRLREKPPSGGVSVYRESIPLDPALAGPGVRLLEALDWQGVAMVECKRDATTGRQVIMEVNGRFWGSLQLAIDAGVDFPSLLVRCATGDPVAPCPTYREGIRSRWFWGDVDHLYLRLRDGSARSRVSAVLDFLRVRPGRDRSEVWRWRDPAPFVVETLQWLQRAASVPRPKRGVALARAPRAEQLEETRVS